MDELWKPVLGWEGFYEASDTGMVRNVMARKGTHVAKILKGRPTHDGYLKVALQREGRRQNACVHRVIYEAFMGQIPEGLEIDHLDFCRTNNRLANLEAVNRQVNTERSFIKGRDMARGSKQGRAAFTEITVAAIRRRVASGEAQNAIAAEFGVTPTAINCIVKRKTWRHVSP